MCSEPHGVGLRLRVWRAAIKNPCATSDRRGFGQFVSHYRQLMSSESLWPRLRSSLLVSMPHHRFSIALNVESFVSAKQSFQRPLQVSSQSRTPFSPGRSRLWKAARLLVQSFPASQEEGADERWCQRFHVDCPEA